MRRKQYRLKMGDDNGNINSVADNSLNDWMYVTQSIRCHFHIHVNTFL